MIESVELLLVYHLVRSSSPSLCIIGSVIKLTVC